MEDDDDCDNGDDSDFGFFIFYSGLHSSLVLSIRTAFQLPYIIPFIESAVAPTGVPPQLLE